jgi:hypothetical protein
VTTHVQRPPIITARIDTGSPDTGSTKPVGPTDVYTVTAYLNATPGHYFGYRTGDTLTEYSSDGTLLRLIFTVDRVTDLHGAADAAFVVGNRQACDDTGRRWPTTARSLSVGDVLAITAPDGTTTHHCLAPVRFSKIEPPTAHTLTFPLAPILAAAEHAAAAAEHTECDEETEPRAHLCWVKTSSVCLTSNARGPHTHTVYAYGWGPGTDPRTLLGSDDVFHAIDLLTPESPDDRTLLDNLRAAHADGATRFLLTYDRDNMVLTTTTD